MLKSTVISAVAACKVALQDLLIDAVVDRRSSAAYVPGQPVSYAADTSVVKAAIVGYEIDEIDHDRILASDRKAIVFEAVAAKPNDTLQVGLIKYRIVAPKPTMVGDTVVMTELQLRPL